MMCILVKEKLAPWCRYRRTAVAAIQTAILGAVVAIALPAFASGQTSEALLGYWVGPNA